MNTLGINITLMQGMIVEQQITNFVLENEYEKELGIVTEADEGKLKAAGEWIGKQVDRFIGILKTWWGKIVHFVTKTIPKYISIAVNWLRGILHLRQKPEKVDASKIDDSNKEKVKEACNQANAATIKEKTLNNKKEVQAAKNEANNFTRTLGNEEKENAEKNNENNSENTEKIEKVKEVKQNAVNTLNTIKENSDKPEEKAEIQKTINNIEQGKTVELSSGNLDYLEGSLINLSLVNSFRSFWDNSITYLNNFYGNDLRDLNKFIKHKDTGTRNMSEDEFKETINYTLKDAKEHKAKYVSYTNAKEQKNISLKNIIKSKKKVKIKKSEAESTINEFDKDKNYCEKTASMAKGHIEITIGWLNKCKNDSGINQKLLRSGINLCNFYMKEATLMYKDMNELYTLAITDLGNFLTTAKPCSGN